MNREEFTKQVILNAFNYPFVATRNMGGGLIYDWLLANGHIRRDEADIKRFAAEARRENPHTPEKTSIILITKSKIVDAYFRQLKEQNIDIKEYL